jgi:hypothetical protein
MLCRSVPQTVIVLGCLKSSHLARSSANRFRRRRYRRRKSSSQRSRARTVRQPLQHVDLAQEVFQLHHALLRRADGGGVEVVLQAALEPARATAQGGGTRSHVLRPAATAARGGSPNRVTFAAVAQHARGDGSTALHAEVDRGARSPVPPSSAADRRAAAAARQATRTRACGGYSMWTARSAATGARGPSGPP